MRGIRNIFIPLEKEKLHEVRGAKKSSAYSLIVKSLSL